METGASSLPGAPCLREGGLRKTWGHPGLHTFNRILKLQVEKTKQKQYIYLVQIRIYVECHNQRLCLVEDYILTCSISLVFNAIALERLFSWLSSYNSVPSVVFDSGSSVWSINKGAVASTLKTEEVLSYFLKGHRDLRWSKWSLREDYIKRKCCLINFKKKSGRLSSCVAAVSSGCSKASDPMSQTILLVQPTKRPKAGRWLWVCEWVPSRCL